MTEVTAEGPADAAAQAPEKAAASASMDEKATLSGWYTVIMSAVVVMLAQIDKGVMALLVQPMKHDLHLSDTQVSLLIALAFTLFYVAVGPPVARLADRTSRKWVVAVSLAIWSAATSLCGLAQNFWQMFLGRAIIGGAESGSSPASVSMIADVIPRHQLPRAYAIYNAGFIGGAALAFVFGGVIFGALEHVKPMAIPGLGTLHNWHFVFIVVGLPGLLIAAIFALTVPEPKRRGAIRPQGYSLKEVAGYVVKNRAMHGPLLAAFLFNAMSTFGALAWLPAFFERTYGWGPAKTGSLLGSANLICAFVGLAIGSQVAMWLSKKRDDAHILMLWIAHVAAVPFLIAAPLMPNPWLALICCGLAQGCAASGSPSQNSAFNLSTPNAMRSQINALYLFVIAGLGGLLGPVVIALLTDFVAGKEEYLRYVLLGFRLVLLPIDLILVWLTIKPYGKLVRERLEAGD
jgi:MFS family permease